MGQAIKASSAMSVSTGITILGRSRNVSGPRSDTRRLSRPRQRSARKSARERRRIAMMNALQALVANDAPAGRAKPLAQIDVLAGFERRVEAADLLERRAPDDQVAGAEPRISRVPTVRPRSAPYMRCTHVPSAGAQIERAGGADVPSRMASSAAADPGGRQFVVGVHEREEIAVARGRGVAQLRHRSPGRDSTRAPAARATSGESSVDPLSATTMRPERRTPLRAIEADNRPSRRLHRFDRNDDRRVASCR